MQTTLRINGSADPRANYISWTPLSCEVRLIDSAGATGPVPVVIRNANAAAGGQVIFVATSPGTARDELVLNLPHNGAPVSFFVAGKFGQPSLADGDARIDVRAAAGGQLLSTTPLMVRVRKDANTLT